MKRFLSICMALVIIFSITGCDSEGHDGEAKTPSGSSIQKGRNYQDVYNQFKEKGFTNIRFEILDDLITGWLTKDGEVESVSVDGDAGYSADRWYPADVEVIITYHTFPHKENEEPNSEQETTASAESNSTDKILTVENCPELAAMLILNADVDSSYEEFATTYKNQIIQFDGCIMYLTNYQNYNTRYDLLVSAGDFVDKDTANPGPIFKFKNVGVHDLGDGLTLAEFVKVGSNIRVQAKVKSYNPDTGIFELSPILIEAR